MLLMVSNSAELRRYVRRLFVSCSSSARKASVRQSDSPKGADPVTSLDDKLVAEPRRERADHVLYITELADQTGMASRVIGIATLGVWRPGDFFIPRRG